MIKVNLLRNMGLAKAGGVAEDEAKTLAPGESRRLAARLVVILLFPGALLIYEKMTLDDIQSQIEKVKAKIEVVRKERAGLGDAAPRIEKYNKEKQRVDKELEIVRSIARNRLREVKALDAIQSFIPARTWAKKISINGGVVQFEGQSTTDDGVSELIRALEGNVYFSKVEPKYTSADQSTGVALKKFELQFHIGKQD